MLGYSMSYAIARDQVWPKSATRLSEALWCTVVAWPATVIIYSVPRTHTSHDTIRGDLEVLSIVSLG